MKTRHPHGHSSAADIATHVDLLCRLVPSVIPRMVFTDSPERLRSSAVETPSWPMRLLTALATSARVSSAGASFDTNSSALCSGHRLADRQPFMTCRGGFWRPGSAGHSKDYQN